MYNILLDGLPTDYRGFKIRTSYRVGVLLTLLMDDEEIDEDYKIIQAIDVLYEDAPKDLTLAAQGISWFLTCGESEVYYIDKSLGSHSENKALDFQYDANDIFGTFAFYNIPLPDDLHWFKFMSIIQNLPEGSPLSAKIGYRVMDLNKFKGQTRAQYADIQRKVLVHKGYTKEEYEEKMKEANETYGSYYEQLKRLNS